MTQVVGTVVDGVALIVSCSGEKKKVPEMAELNRTCSLSEGGIFK